MKKNVVLGVVVLAGFSLVTFYSIQSMEVTEESKKEHVALDRYIGKLVEVPSGGFQMGSNEGRSDERPVHKVNIQSFYIQETETTWSQYQLCINAGVCESNGDEGWGKGSRPVMNVSWNDIQQYISWLNKQTGKQFRLPSEAEWEYAARGGTSTKFSWGNSIDCSMAKYGNNIYSDNVCGHDGKTNLVKSYSPNAYGLYDMHGNVYEFVQDCYKDSYNNTPNNGEAWTDYNCSERVLRGGSWGHDAMSLRAAYREWNTITSPNPNIGFRLVQDR